MGKDSRNGGQEQTDYVPVRRARIQEYTTYEITEDKLERLVSKPSDPICLYLAALMLGAFGSWLSVVVTNPLSPKSIIRAIVYIAMTVGTGLAGAILLIIGLVGSVRAYKQKTRMVEEIKNLLPPAKPVGAMTDQGESKQSDLPPKSF